MNIIDINGLDNNQGKISDYGSGKEDKEVLNHSPSLGPTPRSATGVSRVKIRLVMLHATLLNK